MTRYYFNLVYQGTVIADPEGVELSEDLIEVIIPETVHEMRLEEPELFVGWCDWSIEVVDEQGHIVAKISF